MELVGAIGGGLFVLASLLVGSLGLVTATTLSLAFMPPARYAAWVRTRAVSQA